MSDSYASDQLISPYFKAIHGKSPGDKIKLLRFNHMLADFEMRNQLLFYKDEVSVPHKSVKNILQLVHDSKIAGRISCTKTLSRLKLFYWKGKSKDVDSYCKRCTIYQTNRDSRAKPLKSSQPLESLDCRWGSVSIDFLSHVPTTDRGHDCIVTYFDRLTRRIHLVPRTNSDTAEDVARGFLTNIFCLLRLPGSLVSDRDPRFTSKFWELPMQLCGKHFWHLKVATSKLPRTDDSTKIINQMVAN